MRFQKITHGSLWWPRPLGEGREWSSWISSRSIHSTAAPKGRPWGEAVWGRGEWAEWHYPCPREVGEQSSEPRVRPQGQRGLGGQGRALFSSDSSSYLGFLGAGRIICWSSDNPAGYVFNEGCFSVWSWALVAYSAHVAKAARGTGMSCRSLGTGCSASLCFSSKSLWSRHIIEMSTSLM